MGGFSFTGLILSVKVTKEKLFIEPISLYGSAHDSQAKLCPGDKALQASIDSENAAEYKPQFNCNYLNHCKINLFSQGLHEIKYKSELFSSQVNKLEE